MGLDMCCCLDGRVGRDEEGIIWKEQQALSPCVLLRPEIAWMLCLPVFAFRRNPTFSRCEGVRGRELPTRPWDYHHSPVLVTQACFDRLVLMV